MPCISVIVPVYKVEPYLRRCVDSILAQTFTDFELILVDDGSPDNCPAICDEYAAKDRRVCVIHQENGGLSAARNSGIDWAFANSDSQWLCFIDSDDWVDKHYLEYMYRAVTENHVSVCRCCLKSFSDRDQVPGYFGEYSATVLPIERGYLLENTIGNVCAPAKLYKKELFQTVRFPVGKLHEDLFTTYQVLFKIDKIAIINHELYFYYINEVSITHSIWNARRLDEFEAFEQQLQFFKDKKYKYVYFQLLVKYVQAIGNQYSQILKCKDSIKDAEQCLNMMRKYMRRVLRNHIRFYTALLPKCTWCYEIAYPKAMNLYWLFKAVLAKLQSFIVHK